MRCREAECLLRQSRDWPTYANIFLADFLAFSANSSMLSYNFNIILAVFFYNILNICFLIFSICWLDNLESKTFRICNLKKGTSLEFIFVNQILKSLEIKLENIKSLRIIL